MIRLLAHPLRPFSRHLLFILSQSSCVLSVELTDGRGGEGVGEEPNHMTARKPGPNINDSTLSEGREWRERKREGEVERKRVR